MLLYEHPLSSYAQKVKIALREKGLKFVARQSEINLRDNQRGSRAQLLCPAQ